MGRKGRESGPGPHSEGQPVVPGQVSQPGVEGGITPGTQAIGDFLQSRLAYPGTTVSVRPTEQGGLIYVDVPDIDGLGKVNIFHFEDEADPKTFYDLVCDEGELRLKIHYSFIQGTIVNAFDVKMVEKYSPEAGFLAELKDVLEGNTTIREYTN